ncbi:MAG: hypothetical protein A2X85_02670 [Geobacteraceae bacterium GWF2_54_21]|nr:MAG: hypothetical protein A2X85_02670 [Geobacteraceae bacterium GWF2_54_21]
MNKYHDNITFKIAFGVALACLLVYLPALSCDFINWDDPDYIINNPAIRILDLQFVREAFTTSYMGWWMPLTWISFAIDYYFWELNPIGYHLTNILLHAANAGLVVLVADCLLSQWYRVRGHAGGDNAPIPGHPMTRDGWEGAIYPVTLMLAGMLWALHPLRVESVAWVTERKDVLNGLFSIATMLCYLQYVRVKDGSHLTGAAIRGYILSLVFLLLSLMSKPVSVVIPAMMLVADWYPLGRFRRERALTLLVEKLPFAALVVLVSAATIYFASGNQILVSYEDLPLSSRFLLAGNSLFEYLRLTLYPVGIIHIYLLPWPFPDSYTVKALLVVFFSCICVWQCRRNPWLPATWLAFILPLVPVLGFFQNGAQSHAARFTYLSGVSISICAATLPAVLYGYTAKSGFRVPRVLLGVLVGVPVLVFIAITLRHISAWKNPETLWSRAIAIRPVGRAYYLRADYFLEKGRYLEAVDDLQMSIKLGKQAGFPEIFNLHALRGDAFNRIGRYAEAVEEFTQAISLYPFPDYFYHRGLALQGLGRSRDAETDFLKAGNHRGAIEWRKKL